MNKFIWGAMFSALSFLTSACVAPGAARCDRACLIGDLRRYLVALQARDLAAAPLAEGFRATRNGVRIEAPRALAGSIKGLGDVQRFYADPVNGQAAYLGIIQEDAGPALTAIRIRIAGGRIAESEQLIAHPGDTLFSLEGFRALPPRDADRAPGASVSRPQMVAAANAYFQALTIKDGSNIPHVHGCDRLENGTRVTNRAPPQASGGAPEAVEIQRVDCAGGMERMTQIREVAFRRFPLVDEQAGVVMGVGLFLRPPGQTGAFARRNLLTEFFELQGGEISGIYAVMHYLDAAAPDSTGWP